MIELGKKIAISLALIAVIVVSSATCVSRITATTTPMTTVVDPVIDEALHDLHLGCEEVDSELRSVTEHALKLLQRNGIDDETPLKLLQYLKQSMPADFGRPDVICAQQLGTYVALRTLREGG